MDKIINNKNTILSIYGYGIPKKDNDELIKILMKELTVSPNNNFNNETGNIEFTIYLENKEYLYIPRYYGLKRFGLPSINKLHIGISCPNLEFNGSLREQQIEPVNNFIKYGLDPLNMGGIISVPCGFGKTIMSVYIACHFKKKTMFVSHKDFLNQQFLETVNTFVPNARIGKIKQKIVDVDDKDIVIASLQSLAMKNYDINIFKQFGLVIIDEVHHMGAEVFSRAFSKLNAPIILGLSATLNRKDGLRRVFENFIGKSVFTLKNKENIDVNVKMYKYFEPSHEYSAVKLLYNGKPNCASMINNICNYNPRNLFIVKLIKELLEKEKDRKILILSERRNQLTTLDNFINNDKSFNDIKPTIGYYVGGLSQKDLDNSSTKQIIFATYQMASEGMNIPSLNTVIFASPIGDIQQSIGRILREKPEERKYIPLCIDIWDLFSLFTNRGYTRIKYYKKNNYNIEYYIDDIKSDTNTFNKEEKYSFITEEE